MPVREWEPEALPVEEAQENLRVIRELMERSTKYSTFSGLSGVLAGLVSIAGCLVQHFYVLTLPTQAQPAAFIVNWSIVVALAIGIDFMLTKRRAPLVGKTINSRLGRQMVTASIPALGFGALLTLAFVHKGLMHDVYPYWMLAYGCAVSAVGLFSQKEVQRLGWAFLAAGALTLLAQVFTTIPVAGGSLGLIMIAVSFGGFHIVYGITMSRRGSW
jgi:hypothetical protein